MELDHLPPKELKQYAHLALALAKEGGAVLKHFWGNLQDVRDKDIAGDLVTEADKEAHRRISALLQRECPSHAVLAEESGKSKTENADFLWVIDPLDGTINYTHQYPMVSVSVALVYRGSPVTGVVYNPFHDELFEASQGNGATLNGKSIFVSSTKTLSKSLLATGFPYDRRQNPDNNYAEFCHLTNLTLGVRRAGSAALDLAYVATGRCDAYWERGIHPWDVAAGILLVQEAGGMVSAYDGSSFDLYSGRVLASNGHIHRAVSDELLLIKNR